MYVQPGGEGEPWGGAVVEVELEPLGAVGCVDGSEWGAFGMRPQSGRQESRGSGVRLGENDHEASRRLRLGAREEEVGRKRGKGWTQKRKRLGAERGEVGLQNDGGGATRQQR